MGVFSCCAIAFANLNMFASLLVVSDLKIRGKMQANMGVVSRWVLGGGLASVLDYIWLYFSSCDRGFIVVRRILAE